MATSTLRDLKVWQEAVALAGDLVRALRDSTKSSPKNALSNSIIACATSIAEQVAVGHSHMTSNGQRTIYRSAKQDLLRLETLVAVARHADIIPASTQTIFGDHAMLMHRLLAGYLVYLDRQLAEDSPTKEAKRTNWCQKCETYQYPFKHEPTCRNCGTLLIYKDASGVEG